MESVGRQHWWRRFELGRFLEAALFTPVPRDHWQPDHEFRRRRIVAGLTLLAGATVLGISLNLDAGDDRFVYFTFGLAAVWVVGSLLSGPLYLGRAHTRSGAKHAIPLVQPLALGLLAIGVFSGGAVVVSQIPFLRDQVQSVLAYAQYNSLALVALITLVNGLAEEVFFRGALYAAIGARGPVLWSTVLYALATVVTGNPMLVLAAAVLGLLVGLQRRVTGGILGPMVTHITWSMGMLFILPPLLGALS